MEVGSKMATHGNLKGLMGNFIDFVEANTRKGDQATILLENLKTWANQRMA